MDAIPGQCLARSVGARNQLMAVLLQTLLHSYCTISDPHIWPEDFGPAALKAPGAEILEYDYIVIGAGAAGSVVASRLTENYLNDVLLLEAGGNPPIESEIPGMNHYLQRGRVDWNYLTKSNGKSCLGMKPCGVCVCPAGKMLGGSGGLNGMMYMRGNPKDYDGWAHKGNKGWDWRNVVRYFERSIKNGEPDCYEPNQGYLPLSHFEPYDPFKDVIKSAAAEMEIPLLDNFDDSFIGYGDAIATSENGHRVSSARAFLGAALKRSNLHLIKRGLATKINFDDKKRAKSVNFIYNGRHVMKAIARKEIIISAGSIESPKLLMLSGIGPEYHLESMGIPVIKNLPVGKVYKDHPGVTMFFKIPHVDDEEHPMDDMYTYLKHKTGPLASIGTLDLVGFLSVMEPQCPYPDVEIHHIYFPPRSIGTELVVNNTGYASHVGKSILEANQDCGILMTYHVLLQPKSKGYVKLASPCYKEDPVVSQNFLDVDDDLNVLVHALKYQLKFLDTETFRQHHVEPLKVNLPECDEYQFLSTSYLKCYSRHMTTPMNHPVGTVKMGPHGDTSSVVDPHLRVKGVDGLRVIDASIMPEIISANTYGAAIMIGEKGAQLIREEWDNCETEYYVG